MSPSSTMLLPTWNRIRPIPKIDMAAIHTGSKSCLDNCKRNQRRAHCVWRVGSCVAYVGLGYVKYVKISTLDQAFSAVTGSATSRDNQYCPPTCAQWQCAKLWDQLEDYLPREWSFDTRVPCQLESSCSSFLFRYTKSNQAWTMTSVGNVSW